MRAFFLQLIIFISSLLSLKTAHKLAHFLARLTWKWSEKQRRITLTNIKLCYPEISESAQINLAQASLEQTIKSMFELGLIWKKHANDINRLIKNIHGIEVLNQATSKNQGVLLAVPHFGNWEVLNLWLSHQYNFSFLYKPPSDKKIEKLLLKYRGSGGANQITANTKGVRKIFTALKNNNVLAILPDQQPKNGQGIHVPFMGQSAYTMTLFSKIAQKTKVPVVFAVAERLTNAEGFDLHFKSAPPAIYENTEVSTTVLNETIAEMVSIDPSQYQWTYKRFSIQADGSVPYQKSKQQ